jgi:pseudouridine-5'-phosphate glycosidase/pseudouridine kinase
MKTGALFGVPIPEKYDAISQKIEGAVEQAVAEAERMGISKRGKDVTPWLLKRVDELTDGTSLDSSKFLHNFLVTLRV